MIKKALKGSLAVAAGIAVGLGGSGIALAQDGEGGEAPTAVTGDYVKIGDGIVLNGAVPGDGENSWVEQNLPATMLGLKLNGSDEPRLVYCIQINVDLHELATHEERAWNDVADEVDAERLPKVLGVLLAGYNGSNAAELIEAAGVSGEDLSPYTPEQVAYAGTQAAVWHLIDGWKIDENPTGGEAGVDTAVKKIQEHLLATEPAEEPEMDPYFETDDSEAVVDGTTYGPFTVSTNLGAVTFTQPEGATIVDENGEAVTEFTDGQTFYVEFDEAKSSTVSLVTDSVIWTTPVGRAFVPVDDAGEKITGQNLILAESHQEELTAELEFEIVIEDVPSESTTPQAQLPQTGTNLTTVAGIGAAVVAAGVIALVLMRRRAATAGADWGEDGDDK